MSPRRSSRARTTQPPTGSAAASTSSSSVSSSRTERATRANHKQSSPQKSSTPHSLSSEDNESTRGSQAAPPPQTRRRAREQDHDEDGSAKPDDELEDEIAEEDEITRCLCGQQEYPGPPSDTGKSRDGQTSLLATSDTQGDEAGGLFIQCDICKVWQHGGCVGIMDEATSPEEYFCEECRKDLHKVMTGPKGQKSSRYLPVYEQQHGKNARKPSISKEAEKQGSKEKDRNARSSADSFSKRRSTMNSRAAYDEDEVLRKVIEESKHEGGSAYSETGNRKKRGRDESEDGKQEAKRQRTGSRSPSGSPAIESEEDAAKSSAPKQKPRGAAARSQREKELRDKERERERVEAANRRKGRAERRKAEEAEAAEPTPSAEEPAMAAAVSESAPPETPSADLKPTPAPRKGGRPPAQKRQSRLGRNQYTRDGPTPATNGVSPADTPKSPQTGAPNGTNNGHDSSDGTGGTKQSKTKNWRLEKLSWNDIRRPAGAMQNYIAQRQVELAGEKKSPAPPIQASTSATNGDGQPGKKEDNGEDLEAFKKMNTLQMMDDLSRDLVYWQQMVAQVKEK